jgi:Tfp pilus assembly protein PilP
MKHLYLKKMERKITISNPPTSPFRKGGLNSFPSFLKRGEGRLLKIIYLFLIMFLLLPFGGCKKEQPVVEKPMAEKVKSTEVGKDTKESEESRDVAREEYLYDSKGRRDPFLSLVAESKQKPGRKKGATPIEGFGLEEINLLAIAWDKNKYYALIMLPDGKAYTITEGTRLGLQGGKVQKITEDKVVIREYIKDYKSVIVPKDTVLKLHKEEEG